MADKKVPERASFEQKSGQEGVFKPERELVYTIDMEGMMSKVHYSDLRKDILNFLKENPKEGVRDILGMLFCLMEEVQEEKEESCPT